MPPFSPPSLRPALLAAVVSASLLVAATALRPFLYVVFTERAYLPIHSFAEIASVALAFSIFALYWNATRESQDPQALFIGTGFLAVALLDTMHAFSFPGMPEFVTPSSTEKGIYYWIAARLWAALVILSAAFVRRRLPSLLLNRWLLLAVNLGVVTLAFVAVSFFSAYLPSMFVAGQGLTPLKVGLEYLVVALSLAAAVAYLRAYRASGSSLFHLLAIALVVTVFSELSFTLYAAAYDVYNLLGHVYKVVAYTLIFNALFVWAVRRPYLELRAAFGKLDEKNRELAGLYDQIDNQLKRTIAELEQTAALAGGRAAQLEAVIENITEGVSIADAEGHLVRINRVGRELLGIDGPRPEAYDRIDAYFAALDLRFPDGAAVLPADWPPSLARKGKTFSAFELLSCADGGRRFLLFGGSPIYGEDGNVALVVNVWRDVTAFRDLERLREEWTSVIAHDLRQPATAISGYAQILERTLARQGPPEAANRAIGHIRAAAGNLNKMIEDLLDASRVEAHRLQITRCPVDLAALLREVVERMAELTQGHLVLVEVRDPIPAVSADPRRVEQVLGNLLANAAQYSFPDTEIRVEVEARAGEVEIAVTNEGIGIPPEELPNVCTRFYRTGHGRTERAAGLGLGLYISKGLIEAHGGRLWPASTPGQTTTFRFTLPITPGCA